ncbi:PPOX class F420-dependent oxidoreductase [Branchiibius cervicis]|uniref:PPOX class F420-dependent oxidoreductase n=1 Tax=Branchiibius cervicis TaxID=908252 RepID=A0ABW2AW18_9MICO
MSDDEAMTWLASGRARPGVLATTRADGRPHAAPIWYDVQDGSVWFNTGADTVKGSNLLRTGQAALTVQDDVAPFSFVTVSGGVELIDDLDQVRRWAARIGGRYMGADRAGEYGERNGVPGELLVRLVPSHIVAARDVAD